MGSFIIIPKRPIVGSLHALVFCLTRFPKVLGWSSCLALSNQRHALDLAVSLGQPRPLGTGFFNGSMVLSVNLLLFFPWMAAWLYVSIVRAVALLSALTK